MPRGPHIERRIDLVLVTLLCLLMTGCIAALRREPPPDKQRVVFLGIENAPPALEQAVAGRVDPGYERVSADEYRETARKLEAETMTDVDMARVAHALGVDVIVHGKYVRKNRRRGHLTVTMRTAAVGAVVGEYVIPVRRGAMTKRGERKLDSEFRPELEALLGPPVPAPAAPTSAVAAAEPAPDETARASENTGAQKAAPAQTAAKATPAMASAKATPAKAAPAQASAKAAPAKAAPAQASAKAAPAQASAKATPAKAAPAQVAMKPAKAAPAQAAVKPAKAAPAQAAAQPVRAAAPAAQSPRASGTPAKGQQAVARAQPETAAAPAIRYDDSGQAIDDELPPGLK